MIRSRRGLAIALLMVLLLVAGCGGAATDGGSNDNGAVGEPEPGQPSGAGDEAITYPTGPVTLLVPNPPGGGVDLNARTLQPYLQEALGVNVVVQNKQGAGGNIGRREVYQSTEPDGYTLLVTPTPSVALGQIILDGEFDVLGFTPVYTFAGAQGEVVMVPPDSPFQTIEDIQAAGKERTLSVATPGVATTDSLAAALLGHHLGITLKEIPFDGGTGAAQAAAAGHTDLAITSPVSGGRLVQDGSVRGIAVTGYERQPELPDLPTMGELGFPGVVTDVKMVVLGPPGMPDEIVQVLQAAFDEATANPEFIERARGANLQVVSLGAAETAQALAEDLRVAQEVEDILRAMTEDSQGN